MSLNPPAQYADDRNLRARQRLWEHRAEPFDLYGWVLDLAGVEPGHRVLDVGCGNGTYLREMAERGIEAVGCDLSFGMLRAASPRPSLVNADVTALPIGAERFDVVLAPHMLYHVADREAAARELRRVLRRSGVCVVITNGTGHMASMRRLVESAARVSTPGWEMQNPSTHVFSLENGGAALGVAFDSVTVVRPSDVAPVRITDASVVADYVASTADHYEHEVARPWEKVVDEVRREVEAVIADQGVFTVTGDAGAFICR